MKKLLYLAFLATVLAGCTHEEISDSSFEEGAEKIYATIAETETRVQLNDNLQTVWSKGDRIIVFGPQEYSLWEFDGETGDRAGGFTKLAVQAGGLPTESYYALYPYTSVGGPGQVGNSIAFLFEISGTQNYMKGSYGLHSNFMFGTSEDLVNYSFRNILGYLRLSLTGDKKVEKITVQSNAGEYTNGTFYFTVDDIENIEGYDNLSDKLILDCGDGVQLTDEPVDFYFSLLPTTLRSGITLEIHFTDGTSYPQSTTKSITIERNTIQPMSVINTGNTDWQTVEIGYTGSKVLAPDLMGKTSMSGYVYWGDDSYTLIGNATEHTYIDGRISHTVTVKVRDAELFGLYNCLGVNKIDLSNF